jgi:hypothetical protein
MTTRTARVVVSVVRSPAVVTVLAWVRRNGYPGALSYIAGHGDDGWWVAFLGDQARSECVRAGQ